MISGGKPCFHEKGYLKTLQHQVMHVTTQEQKRPSITATMTFGEVDLEGVKFPHDYPLVVTLDIAMFEVKRILVDRGSSTDLLFLSILKKMGIDPKSLTP